MSKPVDPSLPPDAIDKECDDGGAPRNGGVRLKPANENPWYVLATLAGEGDASAKANAKIWQRNHNLGKIGFPKELLSQIAARCMQEEDDILSALTGDTVNFSQTVFPDGFSLRGFEFAKPVDFNQSDFAGRVSFDGCRIVRGVSFFDCTFKGRAGFSGVTFATQSGEINFKRARFLDNGIFKDAVFNCDVDFSEATFAPAIFVRATFEEGARFENTHFKDKAYFTRATFRLGANFRNSRFSGEVAFDHCNFAIGPDFTDAGFKAFVPLFFETTLPEGTIFPISRAKWPQQSDEVNGKGRNNPVKVMPAPDQKRAYSRLRMFFAKNHQIDEEQFFHRQEMRCKREMARGGTKALYWLYDKFSDYGISIWRPFWAMLGSWFFFAAIMVGYLCAYDLADFGEALRNGFAWSAANMLPFTGFARTYVGYDFYACLPWWLKSLGGVQTVLFGVVLLFLFGLGLRNTFRLR